MNGNAVLKDIGGNLTVTGTTTLMVAHYRGSTNTDI